MPTHYPNYPLPISAAGERALFHITHAQYSLAHCANLPDWAKHQRDQFMELVACDMIEWWRALPEVG